MEEKREEKREVTYYRDGGHNYMVLACPPDCRDNYQYRMLAANQIQGLLECSIRSIDSREYLYYDITSRQCLADLCDRRRVRGADLEELLRDLLSLEKKLADYLLDAAQLVLDPACIYVDFLEKEYSFAYYPGDGPSADWESLFTFLADHVDGREKRAAALIYRLCMMAEKPGFRLRQDMLEEVPEGKDLLRLRPGTAPVRTGYYSGGEFSDGRTSPGYGPERTDGRTSPGYEYELSDGGIPPGHEGFGGGSSHGGDFFNGGGPAGGGGILGKASPGGDIPAGRDAARGPSLWEPRAGAGYPEPPVSPGAAGGPRGAGATGLRGAGWWAAGVLLLVIGAGLMLMGRFAGLGESGTILGYAAGGASLLFGTALLIFRLARARAAGREGREASRDVGEPAAEEQYGKGTDYGDYIWREDAQSMPDAYGSFGSSRAGRPLQGRGEDPPQHAGLWTAENLYGPPERLGETSLLGPDFGQPSGLYGIGSCRGEQIDLSEMPCVVGKLRPHVDQVLEDASISRMHARFSMDREGQMTVRDLNSTNGTWLNGERLQPNESRPMQPGDHLRLGRMEFVFR